MERIITWSKEDVKKVSFWTECTCEFLATTILMATLTFVMVTNNEDMYKPTTTHFGFFVLGFVFMILEGYGPIACLMNPMISFSLFLAGRMSLARALIYMVLEVAGCTAGVWLAYSLTPESKRAFHAFHPTEDLSYVQGVAIEAFFSFNLIFLVLSCHGTDLPRSFPHLPNLALAFALAIGLWAGGTHTGGFMNPIISFGPAQLAGDFKHHWVYWVGPFIGGPLAVPVYKLLVRGKTFQQESSTNMPK